MNELPIPDPLSSFSPAGGLSHPLLAQSCMATGGGGSSGWRRVPASHVSSSPQTQRIALRFPIPSFPHTADSHIHTHTTSSIHPYAPAQACGAMIPRCALSRSTLFLNWSLSRPVSIISDKGLSLLFFIILICKSKFSVAVLTGAERASDREGERWEEAHRQMFSRLILDPRHHLCDFFSLFFTPSAGFVTSCGSPCCNPGEYVKIMLAVWCFTVFAAVGERLAVSGKRERSERGGLDRERENPFRFLCIHSFFHREQHFSNPGVGS